MPQCQMITRNWSLPSQFVRKCKGKTTCARGTQHHGIRWDQTVYNQKVQTAPKWKNFNQQRKQQPILLPLAFHSRQGLCTIVYLIITEQIFCLLLMHRWVCCSRRKERKQGAGKLIENLKCSIMGIQQTGHRMTTGRDAGLERWRQEPSLGEWT